MTGPDHYREAEKLVTTAAGFNGEQPVMEYLAAAQVHATLALAAATAMQHGERYYDYSGDAEEWLLAASDALNVDEVSP